MANPGKRIFKILVPILIIFLPVAAILVMRQGENVYKELPYLGMPTDITPAGDTVYHKVPHFSFKDQFGNNYGSDQLEGKIYVANFFFTRCPNICPVMTSNLKTIQESFGEVNDLRIVSFTLDPQWDTVEALAAYAKNKGISGDQWHFLTGPKEEIYPLMNQKGFLIVQPLPHEDPSQFQHSEVMVLVDKEGHIRGSYDGTKEKDIERLQDEIKLLLLSYKHDKSDKAE